MPKARITRSIIDKLEYTGRQAVYFDTRLTGFGVRVSRSSRSYIVQCRVKGKEVFETIGRCDLVDFDRAIEKAKEILEDAQEGITPDDRRAERELVAEEVKQQAVIETQREMTVSDVLKKYIAARKNLSKGTIGSYQQDVDKHIPDWKDIPLTSITSDMVMLRHAEIGKSSPSRADGAFRLLRALFNFAMTAYEGAVTKNPVTKLSALSAWYKVKRKTSYMKPEDLTGWLQAVLNLERQSPRDFILMLLFTGARKSEISKLTWSDYHEQAGTILFRETKTGEPLEIPVCEYLQGVLQGRRQYFYDGDDDTHIFPSRGAEERLKDVRKSLLAVKEASGIRMMPHDMRRSYLTYCENLDVSLYIRKRLVNHSVSSDDVTAGYTQFSMDRLRSVVEKIAEYILTNAGILEKKPENVLTDKQIIKIQSSDFWKGLSKKNQQKFMDDFLKC